MTHEFTYLHEIEDAEPVLLYISVGYEINREPHPWAPSGSLLAIIGAEIDLITDEKGRNVGKEFAFLTPKLLAHFDKYEVNNAMEDYINEKN